MSDTVQPVPGSCTLTVHTVTGSEDFKIGGSGVPWCEHGYSFNCDVTDGTKCYHPPKRSEQIEVLEAASEQLKRLGRRVAYDLEGIRHTIKSRGGKVGNYDVYGDGSGLDPEDLPSLILRKTIITSSGGWIEETEDMGTAASTAGEGTPEADCSNDGTNTEA